MRKLVVLAAIGVFVWWLRGRRNQTRPDRATIGFADGSSVTLEEGSPELQRLAHIAAGAAST